jgi:nanoRNase/pAp phosphatase (c-di-AMP/oligoRNAs hydrolase)
MNKKLINKDLSQIKKQIKSANKIALFWHTNIDWDSLWAMLWLGKLLEKQWKKIKYFTPIKPGKVFNFLDWIKKIKTCLPAGRSDFDYWNYDLLIFLDFTWYSRIRNFTQWHEKYFDKQKIIVIDHHLWNWLEHWLILKDSNASSTCELVFETFFPQRKKLFDSQIATYFYLWLTTDSGNFLFEKNSVRTLSNALSLIKLWADKSSIVNNIMRRISLNAVKFMQILLSRVKTKWNIIYTYYDFKELKKNWLELDEADLALYTLQNVDKYDIFLFFSKWTKEFKCSLRWKWNVNVEKIAKIFTWWWHRFASAFSLPIKWNFWNQIKSVVNKINNLIKK